MDHLERTMTDYKEMIYNESKSRSARVCTLEWASSVKLGVMHAELDSLHRQGLIDARTRRASNGAIVLEYRRRS